MRNNYRKVFMALVFLVLASYVSYNLVMRRKLTFSSISTTIFNTEPFQLKNSTTLVNDNDDDEDTNLYYNRSSHFKTGARIFCIILTSRDSVETKGRVVVKSWAHKCDNYKLVSLFNSDVAASHYSTTTAVKQASMTVSETKVGNNSVVDNRNAASLIEVTSRSAETVKQLSLSEHGDVLQPPGLVQDSYEKLTDKMFLTFKYLYAQYPDYDWYLKADDDTFIFVDNLRLFLADKNPSKPVTYGYDFKVIVNEGYHSGGGGYILSRESLHRLGTALTKNYEFCENTGTEDVDVARCLRRLGVSPESSVDTAGRERFHPLSISAHFYGLIPDWLYEFAKNPVKQGIQCCSDTTISFHYMSSKEIKKLARIVHKLNGKSNNIQRVHYTFEEIAKEFKL